MLVFGALILMAVAAAMVIGNEYVRRHREVYLLNAFPEMARVRIDDGEETRVGRDYVVLQLAEGKHRAKVSGPISQEFDFSLDASSYDNRWFGHQVWVLNVGGEAILLEKHVRYTRQKADKPVVRWHYGEVFSTYAGIDKPFQDAQRTAPVVAGNAEKTVANLSVFKGSTMDAVATMLEAHEGSAALDLAEWQLRRAPEDQAMPRIYGDDCLQLEQRDRGIAYLRQGLEHRPVNVLWHQEYVILALGTKAERGLRADYDAMLAKEPQNSALNYLRGFVSPTQVEARKWFEKSAALDEKNPWPLFGLAASEACSADWDTARAHAARAVELDPENAVFDLMFYQIRTALGEARQLKIEAARKMRRSLPVRETIRLCTALADLGQTDLAREVLQSLQTKVSVGSKDPQRSGEWISAVRRMVLYALGDFTALEGDAAASSDAAVKEFGLQALIAEGRIAEADSWGLLPDRKKARPEVMLAVAAAFRVAGMRPEADDWRQTAAEAYERSGGIGPSISALLRADAAPTPAQLDEVVIGLPAKALLLATLSLWHPDKSRELAIAAAGLNVQREAPYWLVQKITTAATARSSPTREAALRTPAPVDHGKGN